MAYAIEQDNYRSKRSYITTNSFHTAIYSYTTAINSTTFRQEGRLTAVTTSPGGVALSATNCPAGRVLRENGRKLFPSINPGLLSGDTFQGAANIQGNTDATNHVWVGVFDAVTGVKGFINPNSTTFAVYNSDKALEFVDPNETNGFGGATASNLVVSSGNLGTTTNYGTGLVGYSGIAGSVTQQTNKATAVTLHKPTGLITMNNATLNANTTVTFTLTDSYLTSTSDIVIVTPVSGMAAAGTYVASAVVATATTLNANGLVTTPGTATIALRNITAGNLSEAIVLQYVVIKGVAA